MEVGGCRHKITHNPMRRSISGIYRRQEKNRTSSDDWVFRIMLPESNQGHKDYQSESRFLKCI